MRFSRILLSVPVTLTLTGQVSCSRNWRSTRAGVAGDHTLDALDAASTWCAFHQMKVVMDGWMDEWITSDRIDIIISEKSAYQAFIEKKLLFIKYKYQRREHYEL